MRIKLVVSTLLVLFITTALAGAGRRITAKEAAQHRGELVTVVGPVNEIQDRAEGLVLRIGSDPGLPILVPSAARPSFKRDLTTLHQREIEITGFVTTRDRPLALVLEHPSQLTLVEHAPQPTRTDLVARIRALETELAKVQSALPQGGLSGVTYGPVSRPIIPLPPYPLQPDVLAERGVPTRVEWGLARRVLWYGTERWEFDVNGQLVDVRQQ